MPKRPIASRVVLRFHWRAARHDVGFQNQNRFPFICTQAWCVCEPAHHSQTSLEEQLTARLEERLTQPAMLNYALARFQEELEKRLAEIQKQATGVEDLRTERRTLQDKAARLAHAVAEAGHSTALLSKLAEVEARIAELDQRMIPPRAVNVSCRFRGGAYWQPHATGPGLSCRGT